jgi:hypothetical protein
VKQSKSIVTISFFVLVLVGCGGGSDDDGGTVGGSGLVPYCQRDAGVYNYPDGSSFNLNPDCSFIFTDSNGYYGNGQVISVSETGPSFTADFAIVTGPNKGTCSTITATPTSFNQTNIKPCS